MNFYSGVYTVSIDNSLANRKSYNFLIRHEEEILPMEPMLMNRVMKAFPDMVSVEAIPFNNISEAEFNHLKNNGIPEV